MCNFTLVMQAVTAVKRTSGRVLAMRSLKDGALAIVDTADGAVLTTGSADMVLWARATMALLGPTRYAASQRA